MQSPKYMPSLPSVGKGSVSMLCLSRNPAMGPVFGSWMKYHREFYVNTILPLLDANGCSSNPSCWSILSAPVLRNALLSPTIALNESVFDLIRQCWNDPLLKPLVDLDILMLNLSPLLPAFLEETINVDPNTLNWDFLSANQEALPFLRKHLDKVNWSVFCMNPARGIEEIFRNHPSKINMEALAVNENPNVIEWIREKIESMDGHERGKFLEDSDVWAALSRNKMAYSLLIDYPTSVNFKALSMNENLCKVLDVYPQWAEKLCWKTVSTNPGALRLIRQYPERVWLKEACANDGLAEWLVERYPSMESLFLDALCDNAGMVPHLFSLDYATMKKVMEPLEQELLEKVMHPTRIARLADQYQMSTMDYICCLH